MTMQNTDQDIQAAPLTDTTGQESGRSERLRLDTPDAPPAEWEHEWVDLGGEG
jgi:hypothetical protein